MAKKKNVKHILGASKIIAESSTFLTPEDYMRALKLTDTRTTKSGTKVIGESKFGSQATDKVAKDFDKGLRRKAISHRNKRGYVSSYLDLSVNKPGKYGIDY